MTKNRKVFYFFLASECQYSIMEFSSVTGHKMSGMYLVWAFDNFIASTVRDTEKGIIDQLTTTMNIIRV